MVFKRVYCCLLVVIILQLHAKGFNANFHSRAMDIVPQAAYNGATAGAQRFNKNIHDLVKIRKMARERMYGEVKSRRKQAGDDEKKGVGIKSELSTSSGPRYDQKNLETASLTADYSDPCRHPPRHN